MVIQNFGRDVRAETEAVSAPTFETARDYAVSLVKIERSRGLTAVQAIERVARSVRLGSGTLENIVRDRVKRVDGRIRDRLQERLVRELQKEIGKLTDELARARKGGGILAAEHVRQVSAYLAKAQSLLNGDTRPSD
jgi:hypothetical protein